MPPRWSFDSVVIDFASVLELEANTRELFGDIP